MEYKLNEILFPYSEKNTEQKYFPVAVGKYGIRKREDIYKKELAKDFSKNKVIRKNTLTIGMGSTQIDIGILDTDDVYSVSPAYHTYKINTNIVIPKYLDWLLKCINPELSKLYMIASARQGKSVDFERMMKHKISIPSLEEQEKINKILSKIYEAKIKFYEVSQKYNDIVKSQFIEMFGNIKSRKTLEKLTSKITDGSHNPPKECYKSPYLMLSSQNIYDELILDNVRYISKLDFEAENKRTNIQNGDVLLTIVGTIGRTYVIKNDEKYVFQRSVGVIKPLNMILNGTWLAAYLQTSEAVNQLENRIHGSSQKGIYINDLKKLQIPVVGFEEQKEFEKFVHQIDKSKFIIQKQIKLLEELLEKKMNEYFGD